MLTLPRRLSEARRFTPAQFAELCAAIPDAVLELAADGRLIEMTPAGGETGRRSSRLLTLMQNWADALGGWCVFDSSTSFLLPETRSVEVWRQNAEPLSLKGLALLEGEPELQGLRLDLAELWVA